MAVVEATKDVFEEVGGFLKLRVGFVFAKGTEPKNAEGMLRHPSPPGSKWVKFYFPPTGADLLNDGITYSCPSSMKEAPWGELLLKDVGSFKERNVSTKVLFGRFGVTELAPFRYNEESSYISLRISRPEDGEFNTLYIRHNRKDKDPEYFALMISWVGDAITLNIDPVDIEEVPPHLLVG